MMQTTLPLHAALSVLSIVLLSAPLHTSAAEHREKIAVMKVEAPSLDREEVASLRDALEIGVTRAVGSRLQVITRDSAAASVGGGEKLAACMEGASCDAEIGGALGVDYFVSASVRKTARGLELGVTLLRIGRDASLLKKEVHSFPNVRGLLDGTAAHAEAVTRSAFGGSLGAPVARGPIGPFGEEGKTLPVAEAEDVVVAFESVPEGAAVVVDGQMLCKETPCRRRLSGAHEATFQKERYGASTERFTATKGVVVKATLAPHFAWLTVETEPAGVAIAIDGSDVGNSPVAAREVDEGMVEVAVSDPCYLRGGERVSLRAGERRTVKLAPQPRIAGLRVNTEDDQGNAVEADVRVDGLVVGRAGSTLKVPVCSKRLTVALGTTTFEEDLKLEESKVALVTAKPRRVAPTDQDARDALLKKLLAQATFSCNLIWTMNENHFLHGEAVDAVVDAAVRASINRARENGGEVPSGLQSNLRRAFADTVSSTAANAAAIDLIKRGDASFKTSTIVQCKLQTLQLLKKQAGLN
jgi:hypothetical protein